MHFRKVIKSIVKKVACVALATCLVTTGQQIPLFSNFGIVEAQAVEELTYTVGGSTYTYVEDYAGWVVITGWEGTDTNVVIPANIDGKPVKVIGYGTFYLADSIKSITIPSSVTDIEELAFYGCRNLEKIEVASGNMAYKAMDGVLYSKDGSELIAYPAAKKGGYTLPSDMTCFAFEGTNVEYQDYWRWASVVGSYLTTYGNQLMQVELVNCSQLWGLMINYYDSSYNCVTKKLISLELPYFGGFYASDSHYYILTGQDNPEELEDVEVFRITKYDKNWNELGSTSLYGSNTTIPFRAGSARMVMYDKYLYIRTAHEMYTAEDGRNHQANVSIVVDTEDMTIEDSFTGVMNVNYGYVSHSFNQFIKIDGDTIVAADHGDAYPRSIVLLKYRSSAATGTISGRWDYADVLKIPGDIGNNSTEATIGGLEASSTNYLVAGNSVIQDENNLNRQTRNVYIATVDKNSLNVTFNWITSYAEGTASTTTPHLVKVGEDKFILIWSRSNIVYYTQVDGTGNMVGDIYSVEGNLSDCAPIVTDGKVIWYTRNGGATTFYEIMISNPAEVYVNKLAMEHQYEVEKLEAGMAYIKCTVCEKTDSEEAVYSIYTFWGDDYSLTAPTTVMVGDSLNYLLYTYPEESNDPMEFIVSDTTKARVVSTGDDMGNISFYAPGTVTLTVRSKWNPTVSRTYTFRIRSVDGEFVVGDANDDGEVDVADGVILKQHLAGMTVDINLSACDVDASGDVNVSDAVKLMKYLAGYDEVLGEA